MDEPARGRGTVREVLQVREFRALLGSSVLSVMGDQVTRIAVALLVYGRTSSALAASATYACSYLPWLVAGPVMSTLADRLPRRRLMVRCDLARAAMVALLLVPDMPLVTVFLVLVGIGLLSPAFDAAKSAVLTEVLPDDRYVAGSAVQNTVTQFAQVAGFLVGGAVVALTSTRGALAVDAGTFLLSAALLRARVQERPLPERTPTSLLADTMAGVRLVAGDPTLRRMLAYGLLGALVAIAPEGLAVPVSDRLGGGPVTAGLLTAAVPAGFLLGSALVLRVDPGRRVELLPRLVLLAGCALLLTPAVDHVAAVAVLWAVCGAGATCALISNAAYMQAVPRELRGRAYGVADTALTAAQGALLLLLGALAEAIGPLRAVALAGAAALLCLIPLSRAHLGRTVATMTAGGRP